MADQTSWYRDGLRFSMKAPDGVDIAVKRRLPDWNPDKHPRDRYGKFVEVGDPVRLLSGRTGTYQGMEKNGAVRVRLDGENSDRVYMRSQVHFDGKPDSSAPERIAAPMVPDRPAPAKEPSKPATDTPAKPAPAPAKEPSKPAPAPASKPAPTPAKPTPAKEPAKPAPAQDSDRASTPGPRPEPSPPTGAASEPTGKPTLVSRSQRDAILALKIDATENPKGFSPTARVAATAFRTNKPMTADQAEALADAIRAVADDPSTPKARRGGLQRAASRVDSLSAKLRGFDSKKAPKKNATKITPEDVKDGDFIALPGKKGAAEVFQVVQAKPFFGGTEFTVKDDNGTTDMRWITPDTEVFKFDGVTSVADALKTIDDQEGQEGKPKALYDATTDAAGPGAVTPSGPWYDQLGMSQVGAGTVVPVADLTIEGYTVKTGYAYKSKGRSYLVEAKPGESQADAIVRLDKAADLMEQVLSTAPADKAALQRGMALLQGNNPADSYWAKKYNMPGFHSAATGGLGSTTIWGGEAPKPTTLAHEFGHTVDSTAFGTNQWLSQADSPVVPGQHISWKQARVYDEEVSSASAEFKETRLHPFVKPITVGKLGVTEYGNVDVKEDFAESVRLWMKDRREGKVGYLPSTGENVRYSDLFPERAKILDAAFGTTTDFDTPIRKRRRKETEDKFLSELKAYDADPTSPPSTPDSLFGTAGLPRDEVQAAQVRALEKFAEWKKEEAAKKAAADAAAKLKAEQEAAAAQAKKQVETITSALAAGKLEKADAKKFRLQVTLYKKKLREQGYSEAEVAQMGAAYETELLLDHLGLDISATPSNPAKTAQLSALFKDTERKAGGAWLKEAGTTVHPLTQNQYNVAPQAKANIAAELGSRLNNPDDWEKFRKWQAGNAANAWAAQIDSFDTYTPEERQEMLHNEVSARVQAWAGSSGDNSAVSVLMQEAVKQEFNLTGLSAPRMTPQEFDALMDKSWETAGPWFQRVARVMYEHTQEEFAKAGITHVSLYRGMKFSLGKTPDWADTDGNRRVMLQPINSWSTRLATAKGFAGGTSSSYSTSVMLRARVPVELILGSARTGLGCLNESEFVVFDADGDVEVKQI